MNASASMNFSDLGSVAIELHDREGHLFLTIGQFGCSAGLHGDQDELEAIVERMRVALRDHREPGAFRFDVEDDRDTVLIGEQPF